MLWESNLARGNMLFSYSWGLPFSESVLISGYIELDFVVGSFSCGIDKSEQEAFST